MTDDPRLAAFSRLVAVIDRLRGADGCPWDRSQPLAAMAPHLLEEAYEAADALSKGDRGDARKELGDLLMNVLLAARIAEDAGDFSLEHVCDAISEKLVRRHPHVFAERPVAGVREVLENWEEIKRQERAGTDDPSTLAGIPAALPALLRAYRMGEKAASVGFEWPELSGAVEKLDEELVELKQALAGEDRRAIEEELGDVLFSVVNVARHVEIPPEIALRRTADRFDARFRYLEEHLGKPMKDASLEEMESLWRRAKVVALDEGAGVPEGAPSEWREALLRLARARAALLDSFVDLPPDVLVVRPEPSDEAAGADGADEPWRIADVVEHLSLVDRMTAIGLQRALAAAAQAGSIPPFPEAGLALSPPARTASLPAGRVEAPPAVTPRGDLPVTGLRAALDGARAELLALAPRLVAVDPRAVVLPHPALGELDLLQWFEFLDAHERRHVVQIERIRRAVIR